MSFTLTVIMPMAVQSQVMVRKWPSGKDAAVAVTFDDNCPGQFTHARPALDQKGFKATFFVITGSSQCGNVNWDTIRSTASTGHEIGSHTINHYQLQQKDTATIAQELRGSYAELRSQVPNLPLTLTMAWPYGRGGGSSKKEDTIRSLARPYYFAARNAGSGNGYDTYNAYLNPFYKDYYRQLGTYLMDANISGAIFGQKIRDLIAANGLMTLLYHGVETGGYNNLPAVLFREHLDTLANHQNLWVTTFGNLAKYHKQATNTNINVIRSFPGLLIFSLTDTLDTLTYNLPITLKVVRSQTQLGAATIVKANGNVLPYISYGPNGNDTLEFTVPTRSTIECTDAVGLPQPIKANASPWPKDWIISPQPATSSIQIFATTTIPTGNVLLFDATGKLAYKEQIKATNHLEIETNKFNSGIYQLVIQNQKTCYIHTVMVKK